MRLDDDYQDQLREQLKIAAQKIVGKTPPSEGTMSSVLYGDLNDNGDHWQVDWVHDWRMSRKPFLSAYVWVNEKCARCGSKHGAWYGQGRSRLGMSAYQNGKPKPNSFHLDAQKANAVI